MAVERYVGEKAAEVVETMHEVVEKGVAKVEEEAKALLSAATTQHAVETAWRSVFDMVHSHFVRDRLLYAEKAYHDLMRRLESLRTQHMARTR